ncbi:hypothetical protein N7474_007654 [Penicillium riverlandense]|uniref:uncharacterized protein n=1 Tax=Penicillium riverlandense TaxID=1903569 RepID=UPI0025466DAC|nr:uncharacterized protein N7474_007654 [Penicillium riverlandense]KAJ5811353.1 hypothetical protein N7474_007654 [Penicillium riverlandense]
MGNGDFGSFPIELLGPGHPMGTQDLSDLSLGTFVSPLLSCNCTEEVSESIRTLTRAPMSHSFIRSLRVGVDLVERLLTCPACYDVTKSPRITIQNVLFIGRLMAEITSGYHRYLRWLKGACNALSDRNQRETVYLIPGLEISPVLGFKISGEKLQDLITNGLQADAERLTALARRFALRQRDRHMIGHEACPDAGGHCWREKYGVGLDPLDICPQSPAAKTLTPCYRVVEEVAATIKQFADAVA